MRDRSPFFSAPAPGARRLIWALGLGLALGCAGRPDWASAPPTSLLDPGPEPAVALRRTLSVRIYVDADLQRGADPAARLQRRVAAASALLSHQFGLRLRVDGVSTWERAGLSEAESLLTRLETLVPTPQEDLALAFTGASPPRRPARGDLAWSRYAGRHAVVRTLTEQFERAPEAQHEAETLLVLHAVGRVLGALPECAPGLMSPTPAVVSGPADARFGRENAALIAAHVGTPPEADGPRVPTAVAHAALAITNRPGRLNCHPTALTDRRALWGQVHRAASRPEVAPPAATPDPDLPTAEAALAALDAGDAQGAFDRCAPLADARPEGPASRCAGLAAAALKRADVAARYLRAHLAHTPDDEATVLVLAREVGRSGDDAAARALLARYVAAHPEHLRARVNLGVAHARLGELAEARAAWEAVLARDPENADARDLLERVPAP